jgi:hypothetical protein
MQNTNIMGTASIALGRLCAVLAIPQKQLADAFKKTSNIPLHCKKDVAQVL